MKLLFVILAVLAWLMILGWMGYVCWVASGSPDCNGDPERDAGYDYLPPYTPPPTNTDTE